MAKDEPPWPFVTRMSSPSRPDDSSGKDVKWCPLCGDWKYPTETATAGDTDSHVEVIYCPDCGAKLRDSDS
jgi:hypothetical protein